MRPFVYGLLAIVTAATVAMVYYSPSAIVQRARRRGVYIPPQDFERRWAR